MVYAEECDTSFGFGSLFAGGIDSVEVEIENDGGVKCTFADLVEISS